MLGIESSRTASDTRRRALWGFGIAQVALLAPLVALERRMQRTGGPGIIPFELAGTPASSRQIMDQWGSPGRSAARRSLLLDFPFLVAYSGFNFACCHAASDALRRRPATAVADAGRLVAISQVAAGACDAAENTALLGILNGRNGRLPARARAFASEVRAARGRLAVRRARPGEPAREALILEDDGA